MKVLFGIYFLVIKNGKSLIDPNLLLLATNSIINKFFNFIFKLTIISDKSFFR